MQIVCTFEPLITTWLKYTWYNAREDYYWGNYAARGFNWLIVLTTATWSRLRRPRPRRNPQCRLIGRVIFCQNIFHPVPRPPRRVFHFSWPTLISRERRYCRPSGAFFTKQSPRARQAFLFRPSFRPTFLYSPLYPDDAHRRIQNIIRVRAFVAMLILRHRCTISFPESLARS